MTSLVALPYLILAAAGVLIEATAWTLQYAQSQLQRRWLLLSSLGLCLALLGTTVVRETIRLSAIDIGTATDVESLATQHARAAKVGGLTVFLLFLILNIAMIIYCVALVRRRLWGRSDGV